MITAVLSGPYRKKGMGSCIRVQKDSTVYTKSHLPGIIYLFSTKAEMKTMPSKRPFRLLVNLSYKKCERKSFWLKTKDSKG